MTLYTNPTAGIRYGKNSRGVLEIAGSVFIADLQANGHGYTSRRNGRDSLRNRLPDHVLRTK